MQSFYNVADKMDAHQALYTCFRNSKSELVSCCLGVYIDYDEFYLTRKSWDVNLGQRVQCAKPR